jgi:SSS family transporter
MQPVDYAVIIVFSIAILVAGLSFGKQQSGMKSFFAAGGAVPWSINGLSLFMSFFSAGTFVVWGAIAYQYGWVSVTIQWMMCGAGLAIGFFIAGKWRETGVLTAAEFIRKRLGSHVQKFYTYLFLVLTIAYTGSFLYPVARIVNVSTGLNLQLSIIILGLVVVLYTSAGGLWAVLITDVLQFVILTAAVIIVVPLAFDKVGGIAGFLQHTPPNFFHLANSKYSVGFLIAFAFYNMVFIGGNWAYVQRYTTVKDKESAKKVGFLFSALYLISPVIWMLPPMIYRALQGDLAGLQDEGAYMLMVKAVMPVGMLGLMLAGMIYATASSVSASLNMAAAVITNDIFKKLRPSASNKLLLVVAWVSTFLFGIGTIIVALLVPSAGGIVNMVLSIAALTGAPLYGPPIWALFSKRHTGTSIITITIVSLLVNLFFKFLSPALLNIGLDRAMEMIVGVGVPLILLLAYEIWAIYRKKISQQYLRYVKTKDNQSVEEELEEVAKDTSVEQNRYGMKVLSIALGFTGLLIFIFSFLADKANFLVGAMGIVIAGVAYWIWHFAQKRYKPEEQLENKMINNL